MKKLTNSLIVLGALIFIQLSADAAIIFSDNFNSGNFANPTYSPSGEGWDSVTWTSTGSQATSNYADGQISVSFGPTVSNTPVEVRFKLYQQDQSAGNFTFNFGIKNTGTGQYYQENASPSSAFYGSSGFHCYNDSGNITAGLVSGAKLSTDGKWDYLKLTFTPGTGVDLWQGKYANTSKTYSQLTYTKVASWHDFKNVSSISQFYMTRVGGYGKWYVEDVEVDGTAEPVSGTWVRKLSAVKTIYQSGVPHTDRNGNFRMTYDPNLSFLPIGHYGAYVGTVGTETWTFTDFANAGFNTAMMWQVSSLAEADAAQAAGIKLILSEPTDTQVNYLKNHPATLAYRMYDEPTGAFWSDDMQGHYDTFMARKAQVHALDPVHPFFTLDCGWILSPATAWFTAWNTSGDVNSHDNYPIQEGTTTISNSQGIPETVSFAVSINNQQQPMWFVPQAFGITGGTTYTWRIPTAAQERSMIYTSIIHGATGLIYFMLDTHIARDGGNIGMAPNPKTSYVIGISATSAQLRLSKNLWFAVVQLNSELNALKPSILSPTSTQAYEVYADSTLTSITSDPIRTMLKTDPAGGLTLLLTNIDGVPQNVRIRFPNKSFVAAEMYGTLGFTRTDDSIELACPAWDSRIIRILDPQSIGSVESQANGTGVACSGIVSAVFTDYLYVESADRNFGIRVNKTAHGHVVGETVNIGGVIQTLASGERYISASEISQTTSGSIIEPLGMTNMALGGATAGLQTGVDGGVGLNNIGLLVKTSGIVTTKGTGWFKMDDGSGVSVKVYGTIPSGNPYVTVTGASSCEKDGFGKYQRAIQATSVVAL